MVIALVILAYFLCGIITEFLVPFIILIASKVDDEETSFKEELIEYFNPNDCEDVYMPALFLFVWPIIIIIGVPVLIYYLVKFTFISIFKSLTKEKSEQKKGVQKLW